MKGGVGVEDSRILTLLFSRAEEALEALAKRFGRPLQRIAMNILNNPQDAEEVVNDTYLALWNAIPPAKPEPLTPYVLKTGRNRALNRHRDNTARCRESRYDLSLDELAPYLPGEDPKHIFNARVLGQAIDDFLSLQSRENRILFLRRYWHGDSVQDAARWCGLSANLAYVRLSRMREKLKEHLIQEGFYYET